MHKHPIFVATTAVAVLALSGGVHAHGDDAGAAPPAPGTAAYDAKSTGTRTLVLDTATIRILADATNLGRKDVEVGELALPPGYESPAHPHGSLEMFYVVEGVLGHEVNGTMYTLHPGELGFVKPGDAVKHSVPSDVPMKAVVIWVPGGEADALIEHAGFTEQPASAAPGH